MGWSWPWVVFIHTVTSKWVNFALIQPPFTWGSSGVHSWTPFIHYLFFPFRPHHLEAQKKFSMLCWWQPSVCLTERHFWTNVLDIWPKRLDVSEFSSFSLNQLFYLDLLTRLQILPVPWYPKQKHEKTSASHVFRWFKMQLLDYWQTLIEGNT